MDLCLSVEKRPLTCIPRGEPRRVLGALADKRIVGVGNVFHNSTVVLKLTHCEGSTVGPLSRSRSKPFQDDRLRVALQAGMHEGLTLLEGSS